MLKRDRIGGHAIQRRGAGGDQTDETKAYEFGDPFLLDLKETVMNALERTGPGTPIRLAPNDFEVYRTELRTQAATVVMLDMSRSMLNNGYFLPAKKVALALSALIRGQFPRDALYIVGFSLYARKFTAEQLPTLSWSEWNIGTNMHAGFALSRQLLARHKGGNKQILMVTDGEPTAHLEGGVADFNYPPTERTLRETLKEVERCTRERITINTFMLEQSPWLVGSSSRWPRSTTAAPSSPPPTSSANTWSSISSAPAARSSAAERPMIGCQGSCRLWATRIAWAAASRSPRRSKAWAVRTTPSTERASRARKRADR